MPKKASSIDIEEIKDQNDEKIEKRTLRPKRTAAAGSIPETKAPSLFLTTKRKRKNLNDKEEPKNEEKAEEEDESKSKRNSNPRMPKLFDVSQSNLEDKSESKTTTTKRTTRKATKNQNVKISKNEADENSYEISESVKDENSAPPKSIMKSKYLISKEIEEPKVLRSKRAVRILEELTEKNDQILNIRCDNRTKHTASTSTPSGFRRKPLKVQDVSMISKPEVELIA